MTEPKEVWIPGIGIVSSLGDGLDAHWDALVPVPLYHRRLRTRGFNQARELARGLGKGIREFNDAKEGVKSEIESGMKEREKAQ